MNKKAADLAAPSKTDLEILSVIWDRKRATGREIYEALMETGMLRTGLAYTTIKTYLDRLIQKGYIAAQDSGDQRGTLVYTTLVSRQDVREHSVLLERIVRTLEVRPPEFATWFYQSGKLSKKDKEELETLLRSIPDDALPPE